MRRNTRRQRAEVGEGTGQILGTGGGAQTKDQNKKKDKYKKQNPSDKEIERKQKKNL